MSCLKYYGIETQTHLEIVKIVHHNLFCKFWIYIFSFINKNEYCFLNLRIIIYEGLSNIFCYIANAKKVYVKHIFLLKIQNNSNVLAAPIRLCLG